MRRRNGCGGVLVGIFLLLFGAVFACVGYFALLRREIRANNVYVETTCNILDERISTSRSDDSTTYRAEFHIEYEVDGKRYDTWTYDASGVFSSGRPSKQKILDSFDVGKEYPCWYDPDDPQQSVLKQGYSILGFLFTGIGLVVFLAGFITLGWYVLLGGFLLGGVLSSGGGGGQAFK